MTSQKKPHHKKEKAPWISPWLAREKEIRLRESFGFESAMADFDRLMEEEQEDHLFEDRDRHASFEPGKRIGDYLIIQQIGRGGFGEAYIVRYKGEKKPKNVRLEPNQLYAMKWIPERGNSFTQSEKHEARVISGFEHESIPSYYDHGYVPSEHGSYIVMELLENANPIDKYCDEKGFNIRERIQLFLKLCEGIHFLHSNLVIHADLKPANVLVDLNGRLKIIDFGLHLDKRSLFYPQETAERLKKARGKTHFYACPELYSGVKELGTNSDVYSLGVILYELLCGNLPYRIEMDEIPNSEEIQKYFEEQEGSDPQVMMQDWWKPSEMFFVRDEQKRLAAQRSTSPRKLEAQLGGDLAEIVTLALQKDPARRFQDVKSLADELRAYLEHRPISVKKSPSIAYFIGKIWDRKKLALALVIAGIIGRLILGMLVSRYLIQRESEREQALALATGAFLQELFDGSDPFAYPAQRPRLETLLARGRERALKQIAQPDLQVKVLETLGGIHENIGLYPEAATMYEELLKKSENSRFSDEKVANWNYRLGLSFFAYGKYLDAERNFYQAKNLLPAESPLLNEVDLALCHSQILNGEKDKAEEVAVALLERPLSQPVLRQTLELIGTLAMERGQFAEAEARFSESLALRAPQTRSNALSRQELLELAQSGLLRCKLGFLQTTSSRTLASQNIAQGLSQLEAVFGPDHPLLATGYFYQALYHFVAGEYQNAHDTLAKASSILAGKLHQDQVIQLALGSLWHQPFIGGPDANPDEERRLFERRQKLSRNKPIRRSLEELMDYMWSQGGEPEQQAEEGEAILAALGEWLPAEHPLMPTLESLIALQYHRAGKDIRAEEHLLCAKLALTDAGGQDQLALKSLELLLQLKRVNRHT